MAPIATVWKLLLLVFAREVIVIIVLTSVCLWITSWPQFCTNRHQTLPQCLSTLELKLLNFWISTSKVTWDISQSLKKCELFSAQATLTHCPTRYYIASHGVPSSSLIVFNSTMIISKCTMQFPIANFNLICFFICNSFSFNKS